MILGVSVCFLHVLSASFPSKTEAAIQEKVLKCYRCRSSFTVPADQLKGVCSHCGARYVLPPPSPVPPPILSLAPDLSSYAVGLSTYGAAVPPTYGAAVPPTPVPGPDSISWMDGETYVGQTKTVKGTIVGGRLSTRSGNLYLNFSPDYKTSLSIKIPRESVTRFRSDAPAYYQGKTVLATGQIVREQYLRLIVTDPVDLKEVQ